MVEYTSIIQATFKDKPFFGVINEKDRDRDNNDLLGSKVIIDGKKYRVVGVESFLKPTIWVGDEIGLVVETI